MNLADVIECLEARILSANVGTELETIVIPDASAIVAGDLMSDILTSTDEAVLVVTSLTSDQTVRTADMIGAKALVLVAGKKPNESLLNLAEQQGMIVLSTPFRMFEACRRIARSLEA